MLELVLGKDDLYDETTQEFVSTERVTVQLEHSLVSLSKWESRWEVPFLGDTPKTMEMTYDYILKMIVGNPPEENLLGCLDETRINKINDYVNAKMTATFVKDRDPKRRNHEVITSELIYYWMIQLGIPFEAQHWHLNRLLTLIKVCNFKNAPPKKMSRAEMVKARNSLNEQRRSQFGTNG